MGGGVPLHFDGIACPHSDHGDARGNLVAVDIAGDVIACYIGHRVVVGRHSDGSLITGGDSIDPELVEVLVSCCNAYEESGGKG
jgi:hypothetical protein